MGDISFSTVKYSPQKVSWGSLAGPNIVESAITKMAVRASIERDYLLQLISHDQEGKDAIVVKQGGY